MEGFLLREAGLRIVAHPEFFCPLSKRYVSDCMTLGLVNFTELLLDASCRRPPAAYSRRVPGHDVYLGERLTDALICSLVCLQPPPVACGPNIWGQANHGGPRWSRDLVQDW